MIINCENCHKEFKIRPSRFKRNNSHSCSKKCRNKIDSIKYLGRNNPNYLYKLNDDYFKDIDDNKAYILGWIASDGHIAKRGFAISIDKKDLLILEKIRDLISLDLPIKCKNSRVINSSR